MTPDANRRAVLSLFPAVSLFVFSASAGLGCGGPAPGPDDATGAEVGSTEAASATRAQAPLDGNTVPKFVDPLPLLNGRRVSGSGTVKVDMAEFQQKVLPASVYAGLRAPFRNGTFLWGYDVGGNGPSWPARTIEARQNVPTTAVYTNSLKNTFLQNLLTVDQALHWADPLGTTKEFNCVNGPPLAPPCLQPYAGPIPTTVHLHGAEVPSAFDGHPDTWFTPNLGLTGPSFVSNTYHYGNTQEATALWFHDHALGTVRTNVYSGLAGFYLIRDGRDSGAANNPITLPSGPQEIELMIQDRQFDTNGQLLFPDGTPADNPTGLNGGPPNPDHHPFWVPEFFGDVMTVNGKSWPTLTVQPRRYRFRVLNANNARFLILQMFNQAGLDMHKNGPPGPPIWQIGSDGGLFDDPVKLDDPANGPDACAGSPIGNNVDTTAGSKCLFLAPAERADIIIDFAGQAGKTFTLKNFAVIPFPSGGPVGFGAPDATSDGLVMQFKVGPAPSNSKDNTFDPASPRHPPLRGTPIVDIKPADNRRAPDQLRQLILVEEEGSDENGGSPEPGSPLDPGGPMESLINNTKWNGNIEGTTTPVPGSTPNGDGLTATETPRVGSTEIWEVANLTVDAHPLHIHLIQFQVISRQTFDVDTYLNDWIAAFPGGTFNGFSFPPGTYIPGFGPPRPYDVPNAAGALGGNLNFDDPKYTEQGACAGGACPSTPPDAIDAGWKDTIKMFPGAITRIAVRWAPQDVPVKGVRAGQNTFPFDPTTGGPGYVDHCHILDHEDNEFMRPLLIAR
jgi:FtsP/CotA-like multicopper oxidase with cupredoxin domain